MSEVDHTDALAAEYVLGTLDSDEREQARALLGSDAAFAAKVAHWERRLGELHLMVEPVEPDAGIWARIKSKMPDAQARSGVRLPEAHIPEPAPAVIPTEAPSLDAIEATISETAAVLTSEAAAAPAAEAPAAPASEVTEAPVSEVTEAPVSEVIEALGTEPSSAPASEPAAAAMPEATAEAPIAVPDLARRRFGCTLGGARSGECIADDGCDADGDSRCRRRAGLARHSDAGGRRRAGARPAGGAASIVHGGHSDARRGAQAGGGDATGRRPAPQAAALARLCDPHDACGRRHRRAARRVEVCARARPAAAAAVRVAAPRGRDRSRGPSATKASAALAVSRMTASAVIFRSCGGAATLTEGPERKSAPEGALKYGG